MNLSTLERIISALENSLDSWEYLLAGATLLVVFGLILEYWYEIIDLCRERPIKWKSGQKIIGAILVTVGVAGELGVQLKASRVETQLRSANQKVQGLLNKEAGEAQDRASKADLARVRLEKQMAWRRLSKDQKQSICSAMLPSFSKRMRVLTISNDVEALQYVLDFADAFKRCGLWAGTPDMGPGFMMPSNPVIFGVRIRGPKGAGQSLQSIFEANGVAIAGIDVELPATDSTLILYVGPRPPPIDSFQTTGYPPVRTRTGHTNPSPACREAKAALPDHPDSQQCFGSCPEPAFPSQC